MTDNVVWLIKLINLTQVQLFNKKNPVRACATTILGIIYGKKYLLLFSKMSTYLKVYYCSFENLPIFSTSHENIMLKILR